MRLLCTFPGKYGDLLWALPTIRALSERAGEPIDLCIAGAFGSIYPLVEAQPYIGTCEVLRWWEVLDTAPMTPRQPPYPTFQDHAKPSYDAVLHLGYRDWPLPDLVRHTLATAHEQIETLGLVGRLGFVQVRDLALDRPWVTELLRTRYRPWGGNRRTKIAVGFTDEHFELKFGLQQLLCEADTAWEVQVIGNNPRWNTEAGLGSMNWAETLCALAEADLFVGCCSALHVLAVAMGKPVILVEPAPARHNPVFYPLGDLGPVQLLKGTDGRPTFDSRHLCDAINARLPVPGRAMVTPGTAQ